MVDISTPCDILETRLKESMDANVIIPTVVPPSRSCLQYSARVFSGVCTICFVPSKFSATSMINIFEAAHAPPLKTAELRTGCSVLNPTHICAGVCFSSNRLFWIMIKMKSPFLAPPRFPVLVIVPADKVIYLLKLPVFFKQAGSEYISD